MTYLGSESWPVCNEPLLNDTAEPYEVILYGCSHASSQWIVTVCQHQGEQVMLGVVAYDLRSCGIHNTYIVLQSKAK